MSIHIKPLSINGQTIDSMTFYARNAFRTADILIAEAEEKLDLLNETLDAKRRELKEALGDPLKKALRQEIADIKYSINYWLAVYDEQIEVQG